MRRTVLLVSVFLLAAACSKPDPAPADQAEPSTASAPAAPAAAGGPAAQAKAKEIFATRCTPCHGPTGAGDGPASAGLTPKPRNFHDPAWQTSVDDAYIEKIIKYGGAAVGKSPAMPGNPDLSDPAVIAELRSVVRSFKD
jgi:mono/diheme cytochrome c family protein